MKIPYIILVSFGIISIILELLIVKHRGYFTFLTWFNTLFAFIFIIIGSYKLAKQSDNKKQWQ